MRRAAFLAALMLASCGAEAETGRPEGTKVTYYSGGYGWFDDGSGVGVWTDPGTGCEYLGNGRGLTPRLRDGSPICNGRRT